MRTPSLSGLVATCGVAACVAGLAACGGQAPLTADVPLHLEDHLDVAVVEGSQPPANPPSAVEWRFDTPQPDWKPAQPLNPGSVPARMEWVNGALRVTATDRGDRQPNGVLSPLIYIDLPDWRREDWLDVVVRARTTSMTQMTVGLSTWEGEAAPPATRRTLRSGGTTPVVSDGTVQTYRIRPDWRDQGPVGSWRRLALGFFTREPGSIDILSVSVVPAAALYASERAGLQTVNVAGTYRRTLFTHAPGRIAYPVRVPEGGRLDAALGILGAREPVEFRVLVRAGSGEETTLFVETLADSDRWAERSVDLARFAGQVIMLTLETRATTAAAVAFWGAPTVSGARRTVKPNVIFYVIDGAGADYMSVYGYNRRTTPNLEKLAAEGALFERVYSNSSWTKPSVTSFMTSLHSSVLGNTKGSTSAGGRFEPLPEQAITMAERFHAAGYATGVFTSNPWAGAMSSLERGVDLLPERDLRFSSDLQRAFWSWRQHAAGQPYWVHFQPEELGGDDVPPPFAGLFVSPNEEHTLREWSQRLETAGGDEFYSAAFEKTGISRAGYYTLRQGIYDQWMAYADHELGRLIDRLKASGEWSQTLLIVAADHSIESATNESDLARLDQLPPRWMLAHQNAAGPLLRPTISRVPLIVVWPGQIKGGQRFDSAVSMIDVLPTVLDLTGLPRPEVAQGQSLAPLLLGQPGWSARPVILDEFEIDPATSQLRGRLEVVDAQWGASMWIGPPPSDPELRRPWPVLVYDLWNDPLCLQPINEQRPDLVKKYTMFLDDQWKAHQELGTRFKAGPRTALTPEQLERLRALGYIR